MRGVAEQAQDAVVRARQIQDLQAQWRQQLLEAHVVGLAQQIAGLLFEQPVLSVRDVTERFSVSHFGASKALRRLSEMQIVEEITGRARNRLYAAGGILRIVG